MRRLIWLVFVAFIAADLVILADGPLASFHADGHNHNLPMVAQAQSDPTCSQVPLGALPPARPTWCSATNSGASTFTQGGNSWLDEFNHGLSNASTGAGYRVFESKNRVGRTQHFRHNEHWMVDVNGTTGPIPNNFGGAVMRPDRTFRFENGKLVVEADVAAGISEYGGEAWPELTITTAPAPTARDNWGLYAYNLFPGHYTLGCILYSNRSPGCALLDNSGREPETDEIWQASNFQLQGSTVFGGDPGAADPTRPGHDVGEAWRVCRGNDPDLNCRDRFRWEITKTSFTLYVNGTRYFEQSGLFPGKQIPDALVNGDVYVYFGSYIGGPQSDVVRFHWDHLAVNPGTSGSPSTPTPTAGPRTATPTPTAGPATLTPTPTVRAGTSTPTPTPRPATSTLTPIPGSTATPLPISCTPSARPRVRLTTAATGPGQLLVTVAAGTNSGVPNNRLRSIQMVSTNNALVDIGGQTGRQGNFSVQMVGGTQQTTFTVRRATPGAGMHVPINVVDDCGAWSTFVGAGPSTP
jgi:hypothetical protein